MPNEFQSAPRIATRARTVGGIVAMGVAALLGISGVWATAAVAQRIAPRIAGPAAASRRLKVVVVVFDGLRPDHVSSARTPALQAMGERGVISQRHHSIFPTVTRVNASALATGTGPASHGILDNTIYLPTVRADRSLNTGDAADMLLADSVLQGRLLTVPTLQDYLSPAGLRVVVASAGSSGSAYLLAGAGRAVTIGTDFVRPAALRPYVERTLGPAAHDASPNLAANARAVEALLRVGVDSLNADVAYLWISDPDHTAHAAGLGSVMADSSIRAADREFARLLAGLAARGLTNQVDVIVVSDHGFSTHAGRDAALPSALAAFTGRVTVAGGAVYVRDGNPQTRAEVVRALQASPAIGAIFTAPRASGTGLEAVEPGTLSYATVDWGHPRAGDVLFSANWSHAQNAVGIVGRTEQGGTAGHGTSSPYDITATFVAAGPHFKRGVTAPMPSSNADIVPTILTLLGVSAAPEVTGRSLGELLTLVPAGRDMSVSRDSVVAERLLDAPLLHYRTVLHRTRVGRTWYVDSTATTRTSNRSRPRQDQR